MKNMGKRIIVLLTSSLLLGLLLSACASTLTTLGRLELLKKDEALVFGRIVCKQKGKRVNASVFLRNKESGRRLRLALPSNGEFYVALLPGRYEIGDIFLPALYLYAGEGKVGGFTVEPGSRAVYVGDLLVDVPGSGLALPLKVDRIITDRFEVARDRLGRQFPDFRGKISKSLIEVRQEWLAPTYYNQGAVYGRNKGFYDKAISDFTKALEIDPRYAKAYKDRGIAYYYKGQYDGAISDFTKALEIDPRYAEAYNNRGNAYHYKGQDEEAISDFTKAIEINRRFAPAYYNRGAAYQGKGQYEEAISDFTKAIEINRRFAPAYYNKALASEKAGRKREAIKAYRGFIKYAPPQLAPFIELAKDKIKKLER